MDIAAREQICYGQKVTLYCEARKGHVHSTQSAVMPIGVSIDDVAADPVPFERAVFIIAPAEGDCRKHRYYGEELKFGQVVRFLHDATNSVLTCTDESQAVIEKANYRVWLQRQEGADSKVAATSRPAVRFDRWRVLPRYKVRGEGERVRDNDPVILQASTGEQFFLSVSKGRDIDGCHEVSCGSAIEGFTMRSFDQELVVPGFKGEDKELRGGSCVMLFHREELGFVTTDVSTGSCVLDPYDDSGPIQGINTTTAKKRQSSPLLFQSALSVSSNAAKSSRGQGDRISRLNSSGLMFIVEFEERSKGGLVTSGARQVFRLKSLANQQYLCVRSKAEKLVSKADGMSEMGGSVWSGAGPSAPPPPPIQDHGIMFTKDRANPGSLFCFYQAADDDGGHLENRTRAFIHCPGVGERGVWLVTGGRVTTRGPSELVRRSSRPRKKLSFQDQQSMRDGLEILKVSINQYASLTTILSCLPPIDTLAQKLNIGEPPDYALMTQVRENVRSLQAMCFQDGSTVAGGDGTVRRHKGGVVDVRGQTRLLEQGVANSVLRVVRGIKECALVDFALLGTTEQIKDDAGAKSDSAILVTYTDIKDLLDLCFGLVEDIVRGNPITNTVPFLGEVDLILSCVKAVPSALSCLMACCRNNPLLVDTPEDTKLVRYLCDWLEETGRHEGILEALSLVVECEGTRLAAAQAVVCERLLKRRDVASALFAPLTSSGGAHVGILPWYLSSSRSTVDPNGQSIRPTGRSSRNYPSMDDVAQAGPPQSYPITKLIELQISQASSASTVTRMSRFIKYLTAQLNLFAALCSGRNATSISIVHHFVPVEILLPMIASESIPVTLRSSFVKMFNLSVVDVEGGTDLVDQIQCIRHVIDGSDGADDAYRVEMDMPEMLGNCKGYVLAYLRQSGGVFDTRNQASVEVLGSMLQLLFALLRRGMFLLTEYVELVWLLTLALDSRNDANMKELVEAAAAGGGQHSVTTLETRFVSCEDSRVMIRAKVLIMQCIALILDLVITQHVCTVVNNFTRGFGVGHFSQLIDFDVYSKVSTLSLAVHERKTTIAAEADSLEDSLARKSAWSKGERLFASSPFGGGALDKEILFPVLSHTLGVLMDVSQYHDRRMRVAAIQLFCSLTDFPGEILSACRRVQLLTSRASAGFYNTVKQITSELEVSSGLGTGKVLSYDRMMAASSIINRLEGMLASKDGGSMLEKIFMMRHVGVPHLMTSLLAAIPTPPREEYRKFVFETVALLKTLAQDGMIAERLREEVGRFSHLTSYDMDILSLLRALFVDQHTEGSDTVIPQETFRQIVTCLTFPHSALPASLLLQDILGRTDNKGKYIMRNQIAVWKTLIGDAGVSKMLKFRRQWTGRRGRPMRDSLLQSRDYFNPTGSLRLHLELVKLLYLIAKHNDSVRPDEILHEVFGSNALEDLLEVTTNQSLPMFFRHNYLQLLKVLVLDDRVGFGRLLNHRQLPDLVETCQKDVEALAFLCVQFEYTIHRNAPVGSLHSNLDSPTAGGRRRSPSLTNESTSKLPFMADSQVQCCAIGNELDQAVEERRSGLAFYSDHVALAVLPALQQLMISVVKMESSRVSLEMRAALIHSLNEVVDVVCDTIRSVFITSSRGYREYPSFGDNIQCRYGVQQFLVDAGRLDCKGLGRWADDIGLLAMAIPTHHEGPSDGDEGTDASSREEKALTSRWLDFLQKELETCSSMEPENAFVTAAGIILRAGPAGTRFATILVQGLDEVGDEYQRVAFNIVRQIARLQPLHPFDDSCLLWFDGALLVDPSPVGDASKDEKSLGRLARPVGIGSLMTPLPLQKGQTAAKFERLKVVLAASTNCVNLSQQLSERLDLMARWGTVSSTDQVLPTVISLLTTDDFDILWDGTTCAITLLEAGNRRIQDTFINWALELNDEEIFVVLRNRFSACRDTLRYYRNLKGRGITPAPSVLESLPLYRLLVRLVQLLCEGHNDAIQRYLRAQPDNQVSVNVLEALVEVLEEGAKCVDKTTVGFTQQVLATIAETIQGPCRSNQDMFVATGMADQLVTILSLPPLDDCPPSELQRLRLMAMTTLLSLIEGRTESAFVATAIASLDLATLGQAMDRSVQEYEEVHGELEPEETMSFSSIWETIKRRTCGSGAEDHGAEMNDELSVGASVFIFFKSCLDLQQLYGIEFTDRRNTTLKQALRQTNCYKAVNKKVAMVEIIRGGVLERAYFRVPSVSCVNLKKESQRNLIKVVARESDNERLLDFFRRSLKLVTEIEYYARLRRVPIVPLLHDNVALIDNGCLLLAFVINLLMLATFEAQKSLYLDAAAQNEKDIRESALLALGIVLLIFQSILFVHLISSTARVMLNDYWTEYLDEYNRYALQDSRENLSIETPAIVRDISSVVPRWKRVGLSIVYLLQEGEVWQRIIFLGAAIGGVGHSPIWYSVMLLQVAVKNEHLFNVVLAVTQNGWSLLLTGLLGLCIIFIFALIAYTYFSQYYSPFGDLGNGFHCRSLLHCFIMHVIYGIQQEGITSYSDAPDLAPAGLGWAKMFFDWVFYVVIMIIFLNIVFGIIIDTFAELREKRAFIIDDQQNKCFICGIEQNLFDKVSSGGFEHHVQFEHNMWAYLYFFHYILLKDPEDLNGQEQDVYQRLMTKDPSFFPIGKAMMLSREEDGEISDEQTILTSSVAEERMLHSVSSTVKTQMAALEERLEKMMSAMTINQEEQSVLQRRSSMILHETSSNPSSKGGSTMGGGGSLGGSVMKSDENTPSRPPTIESKGKGGVSFSLPRDK